MTRYKFLPFNFKSFKGKYMLVNNSGEYAFLSKKRFNKFINKNYDKDILRGKFFYKDDDDLRKSINDYYKFKSHLNYGTTLFIVVLTNLCNQSCIYCQASTNRSIGPQFQMTQKVAKKSLDLIFQSPLRNITIEFQGGEPLLNFEVLKFIVEYSKKFKKKQSKKITFNLVSNLLVLNEDKLDYLLKNNISIATSLDGHKIVQEHNRPVSFGQSYDLLRKKIKIVKKRLPKNKRISFNAIQTTTKKSLAYPKEIVDEYVSLGFNSIFLRPLNPFGIAKSNLKNLGYSPYDFIKFYKKALKYIIKLNIQGTAITEATAQIFLQKIFKKDNINFMDLRSPCGASIGQMAFNYDGEIFTCDEGRMMAETGDKSFRIGNVNETSYKDLYDNDVTKIMSLASTTESFPRCYQCTYQPYCGVCPIVNYTIEGDILKNNGYRCIINESILDILFTHIKNDTNAVKVFKKWIR